MRPVPSDHFMKALCRITITQQEPGAKQAQQLRLQQAAAVQTAQHEPLLLPIGWQW